MRNVAAGRFPVRRLFQPLHDSAPRPYSRSSDSHCLQEKRHLTLLSQLRSYPNLLTLLRLSFIPFIISSILDGHYLVAISLFFLAGVSDGFDGLLARRLGQRTRLGEYLDPIADKLLLSTLFLVLAIAHRIPWRVTMVVFGRDLIILVICTLVYATTPLRDFSPTLLGKASTVAQILTAGFTLLREVVPWTWVRWCKLAGLWIVFVLTVVSALHYVYLLGVRLRALEAADGVNARAGQQNHLQ